MVICNLGKGSVEKSRLLSGIARISETPPTHPPIRATWSSLFWTSKRRFTRMTGKNTNDDNDNCNDNCDSNDDNFDDYDEKITKKYKYYNFSAKIVPILGIFTW